MRTTNTGARGTSYQSQQQQVISPRRGTQASKFDPAVGGTVTYGGTNVYNQGATNYNSGGAYNSGFSGGVNQGYTQDYARAAPGMNAGFGAGDQHLTEAARAGNYESGVGYNGSPSRIGQGRILDSHVVSRKVAKYDPAAGNIEEEVEMDLAQDGRVRRATVKSNAGNLNDRDFF